LKEQHFQKIKKIKGRFLNRLIYFLGKTTLPISILLATLLIFCTSSWSLNNSDLSGTYVWYSKYSKFSNGITGGWGMDDTEAYSKAEVNFDGAGGWSLVSATDYRLVREISEELVAMGTPEDGNDVLSNRFNTTVETEIIPALSGTYTVSSDGAVILSFTDESGPETLDGFISKNGESIIFGDIKYVNGEKYGLVEIGVGFKKVKRICLPCIFLLLLDD